MAETSTDNWQIDKILTVNWHLHSLPHPDPLLTLESNLSLPSLLRFLFFDGTLNIVLKTQWNIAVIFRFVKTQEW